MTDSIDKQADAAVADLKHTRRQKAGFSSPAEKIDRSPPHSPEGEQGVLGCILLDPQTCIGECMIKFKAGKDVFYDLRHGVVYDVVVKMYEDREPIDVITIQQKLKDRNQLEQIGGISYLASLPDKVPSASNLDYYLEIVLEKYVLRKLIHTCTDIVSRVYDHQGEVEALLDEAEQELLSIRNNDTGEVHDPKKLVSESINQIELMGQRNGVISGMTTGFPDFDHLTDGLHPGEMIVIAGLEKAGKTAFVMNIAEHVAVDCKLPVGVFSLEMTGQALMTRMLCSRARVNLRNIRDGFMAERDYPKLTGSAGKLANSPLHIDDSAGLTIGQLRAKARRMVQKFGIKLFVVDYLQLLSAPETRKRDSREQEVAAISKGIKALAKESGCPVIVLSQLNSDGELRESRAIGQDADLVGRLEVVESDEEDKDPTSYSTPMRLKIMAQRNGPTGDVMLTFLKCYTRFESAAKINDSDMPTEHQASFI